MRAFGLMGMLCLTLALASCSKTAAPPAPPPNILLISVDTLRQDHLGCYGYSRPTSPNLDALAKSGTVFTTALSTCSWTLPAHASMLTGLYPSFHGLQDDGVQLAPRIPTLAECLSSLGYQTIGVVAHVYVSSKFGLQRGFKIFDDSLIKGGETNPIAEQVVDRFLKLMGGLPRERYFAFIHFFDPHWDYTPPPPFNTKFTDPAYQGPVDGTLGSMAKYYLGGTMPEPDRLQALALYDGEIAYVDSQIGRLLDALRAQGRLENTLIMVTADHGEEFKEHGRLGHGNSLFGEQLRIPLIAAGIPAFPATRRNEPVSQIDILPTLVALAGGHPPASLPGHSLLDPAGLADRPLFSESIRFGDEMRAVQLGSAKMIHYQQGDVSRFYDLYRDPLERQPCRDDPTGGRLSSLLADYAARADAGWHMKLINVTAPELRCTATVHAAGRIVRPRRYYSGHRIRSGRVGFTSFKLSRDASTLTFDATVYKLMASVVFQTDPPDAPVTFDVDVERADGKAGVFLGRGASAGQEILQLVPGDSRLTGTPPDYTRATPGCYIRDVNTHVATGPKANLSPEARRRLESLGYLGDDKAGGGG